VQSDAKRALTYMANRLIGHETGRNAIPAGTIDRLGGAAEALLAVMLKIGMALVHYADHSSTAIQISIKSRLQ